VLAFASYFATTVSETKYGVCKEILT
jgi:hypothetical protein